MKRRELVNSALLLSTSLPFSITTEASAATDPSWRMPDESEAHSSTWMAFGANRGIWGAKLLPEVQRNLALIANTIAKYEPVNMLVNNRDLVLAKSLVGKNAVTVKHLELLKVATDAQGRKLEVITLEAPSNVRKTFENKEFAAGYIGFYVCNGAVIAQEFGDAKADAAVRASLQRAFPNRTIEMLNIDGIAAGGGSIHCTTQQEIKV